MEIPGADISASFYREHSSVRNFHMSWAVTDVSDWLLQLALALYKHHSKRSIIHRLLSAYSNCLKSYEHSGL